MSIAVVTSSPGALTPKSSNGAILRRWLKEVGINPEECIWLSLLEADLPYGDKMSAAMIRNGTARLMNEVAMHNPEVVIAVGSDATKIDSDLWRQDMSKRHGHSGKLWGKFPAIGMYHPNTYAMQKETRRRTEIENSCKLVLSRALHLNDVIEMPHVTVNDRTYVNSEVGFDCETTQDLALAKAYRGKSFQKNKTVEPRASKLKMVGTSDGLISFSGADFGPNAEPIAFNMPFDALIAADASPRPDDAINAKWHDPKMWAHLLGERDTEMKSLALRLLGRPLMHYDEAGGTDAEPSYCVADSIAHRDILNECRRRSPAGVAWLYENVERPMLRLYSRWSRRGVFKLDAERCAAIQAIQTDELERLALAIWQKTGIPNPNQYKKVAEWLGTESADEATLREHMDRDGVPDMLDWRERNKSKSTYVDAYLLWPAPLIGTLWRPTGAWTGRPASAATNLQNVPDGCKHKSPDDLYRCVKCGSFNIRKLLGPEDGYELWSFDNSQLEIRIAAHISQDKNMLALLRGEMPGYEDGDIHRWATELLGAKNRTFGKIGNFATLYGGSEGAIIVQAAKFNVDIETIRPMAKKIHDTLPKMFPDFFAWKRTVEFRDRVPGMFGAILVPPSHPDESYLQRERVNAPIQRGGVDTLKLQTLALEAEGFESVHQIHDEVLVKVHKSDATDATRERIRAIMTQAVELDVPLKVDSKLWAA